MIEKRSAIILILLTTLYILTLAAFTLQTNRTSEEGVFKENESLEGGRNERSTPRDFILPATPAVKEIQERRLRGEQAPLNGNCLSALARSGGLVYDFRNPGAAGNIATIIEFQRMHGLNLTGNLDKPTRRALKCAG